jgi:cell division protein FtsB
MINKKAGFDIQNYLVTIILFMGILVTFGGAAVSLSNNYAAVGGANVDDTEFKASYNKLSQLDADTKDLKDKVEDLNSGTQDSSSEFFGDALNSIKLVITGMGTGVTMVGDIATDLEVPSIWKQIATTILIIMIVTTIIFMIVKSRGT